MYQSFFKRIVDVLVAVMGLLILCPVLFIVFIYLYLTMNGSPFFFQIRTGLHGDLFTLFKFRTMNEQKDTGGNLLTDHKRITPFGYFLRVTSIDELPQLVNVIKGDMSLVGPRPLLPEYLPLYSDVQWRRFEVRPGITGWAQINGRNSISWKQKFEYDVWYIDRISFLLDAKILFKTIIYMFSRKDINNSEKQTMPKFNGSN